MDGMEDYKNTKIKVLRVKAKHLPIECPVCHGFGTLKYGAKVCQGCSGQGFILVDAEEVKNGK